MTDPAKRLARIYALRFGEVYPLYVQKVERKGRTREELDQVLTWMTGYEAAALADLAGRDLTFEQFFREAPAFNPGAEAITGSICGVRIEALEDPLEKNIRRLDKLVDDLAKGRKRRFD